MKLKLYPSIFLRAAKLIDSRETNNAHTAIMRVNGGNALSNEQKFLQRWLLTDWDHCVFKSRTHRVYALLLAATLAAHEGKK